MSDQGTRHRFADFFEGKRKPTITELEEILADNSIKVSILPSGEIVINNRIAKLEQELAEARREIETAMAILDPNMPEQGLEDAATQVKQAAISQSENCERLAQKCDQLRAEVKRLKSDQVDWRKGVELIASGLGEQNPPDLCCARLFEKALELRAEIDLLKGHHPTMAEAWAAYQREAREHRIKEYGHDPLGPILPPEGEHATGKPNVQNND